MAVGVRSFPVVLPSVDRRRILGIFLAAIAGLLVLFLTRPEPQIAILVASNDLVAGQPLADQGVSVRYVTDAEGFVAGTGIGELAEWSLRAPIAEGEPLIPSLLQPPELLEFPNVMALSLDQKHAVLGNLVAGDRVDVYRTSAAGFDAAPVTTRVAMNVYVVDARVSDDGINRDRVDLLLAVDEDLAALIAGASRGGEIDLVRVSP